jgi:hypothetical protein
MRKMALCAGVVALALNGGVAAAQTATDTTTTQTTAAPAPAPIAPPPVGTLSSTHEHREVDAYGNQVVSKSTTYRDGSGVAQDTRTTTTTAAPPPPPVTTSTTTERTTSGPPPQ